MTSGSLAFEIVEKSDSPGDYAEWKIPVLSMLGGELQVPIKRIIELLFFEILRVNTGYSRKEHNSSSVLGIPGIRSSGHGQHL